MLSISTDDVYAYQEMPMFLRQNEKENKYEV